ncbi:MAG: hypothetical protein WBQ94_29090 [Terracidiphilus sp.]
MNRNQGITAGAILAAGMLLRPTASVAPVAAMSEHGVQTPASKAMSKMDGEGPWLASCKYWAPVRDALQPSAEKKAKVTISVQDEGGKIESETHASAEEDDSECPVDNKMGDNPWGFPSGGGAVQPKIHAIVATVDNPVHSHEALAFDREIDALIMAAGDNGYVPSYFWLPWKAHAGSLRAEAAAGDEDPGHNAARERQPGLIVFKRVHECEPRSECSPQVDIAENYSEVIYLFLVGESPALGVDGSQLRNAFRYERELGDIRGVTVSYSMKGNPESLDDVAIIGPIHSGSAASLRAAIEALGAVDSLPAKSNVDIAGTTQTRLASELLFAPSTLPGVTQLSYVSFSENLKFEERDLLLSLVCSGYRLNQIAELSEDGTVYGYQGSHSDSKGRDIPQDIERATCPEGKSVNDDAPIILRFPRNISLLRNAHPDGEQQDNPRKSSPTPFLHLSLKDFGTNDSTPQYSPDQTPLSQEAQLMSISRLLGRARVQFILIQASNVLDELYLAQFLHRACPEARIVFIGGDLLFGRETENVPYVGTVTFSAYSLLNPTATHVNRKREDEVVAYRAFPDSFSESYFNAASYTFWDGNQDDLHLANYLNPLQKDRLIHASLWATVIGRDGYYPLAIVDDCASDSERILPTMESAKGTYIPKPCVPGDLTAPTGLDWFVSVLSDNGASRPIRYPGLSWQAICILIMLLCLSHAIAVLFPRYWSPLTRDLVINKGTQPYRRSMYIFIGTVMLFCMGFAAAYPIIPCFRMIHPDWRHSGAFCLVTMTAAIIALAATLRRTHPYLLSWKTPNALVSPTPPDGGLNPLEQFRIWLTYNSHLPFNVAAVAAALLFAVLWTYICSIEVTGGNHTFVGPLFSYRCLYPGSGVCPLTPVLLVLLGWYAWAVTQTLRLRFSNQDRPQLPGRIRRKSPWPLFVSDPDITECKLEANCCLESNITCLLITRQVLHRIFPENRWWPTGLLLGMFFGSYCLLMFGLKLGSIDRFLWQQGRVPAPYEFLIGGIAFPLVIIALTAWLRTILVWGSLKRGLLEPLEQLPLRYAFTRLKGLGWVNMMRQGGLLEQWRDMARSTESMRQMVHDPELCADFLPDNKADWEKLTDAYKGLDQNIHKLMTIVGTADVKKKHDRCAPEDPQAGLACMVAIEQCYAKAAEALLAGVLLPYWEDERVGMVEGEELSELPVKARTLPKDEAASGSLIPLQLHASTVAEEPTYIRVAEEFLAIRYVSLIRAVLVNIRRLLTIVSVVFVFTIVAWNAYPFQPRQLINEAFTGLLLLLGAGIVWIFAQMHRNAILSRITDTNANELGWDFYLRLFTFGAVPVLTWLAYQFPEVGVSLFRFVQPGLEVMK